MMRKFDLTAPVFLLLITAIYADGPQDNSVENVRPVPPLGIELSSEDHELLEKRLGHVQKLIEKLEDSQQQVEKRYLPDVQVLHRAVEQAVHFQEMFHERDIATAFELLDLAEKRANQLLAGQAPWTKQQGLVIRGFISDLDGTVQPYGLEIADDYDFEKPTPVRCDIWFHGRGERSMELHFLSQRLKRPGQYPPTSGIVLHPYGRYSNAFKFAGEVDTLEALAHVQENYRIDPNRVSVRGFSMGGAACWQFAVHYTDQWFAATPGAGFSETPRFLKSFQGETLNPPWYEEKLWRMYDCDLVSQNLAQVPTIAYSGEIDRQKQAADVMEQALAGHNIDLLHIIGPNTGHKIHSDSKLVIQEKMESLANRGRVRFPKSVHLSTYTLKYPHMHWVTVSGLKEHWERSTVDANIESDSQLNIQTKDVTEFSIDFPAGHSPFALQKEIRVTIDGQQLPATATKSDLSFHQTFHLQGGNWTPGPRESESKLRKRHNLQGPVDDALMAPFLFVTPSQAGAHPKVDAWVAAELKRAQREWRRHMRGNVRIKADKDVSQEDREKYNLILWGTPASNSLIAGAVENLPIKWTAEKVLAGKKTYEAESHLPILIYPNPRNPQKYIVFNSSFTYREYDYLNNARQTPKLPDWAIIDVTTPPNSRWPGKIVDANFFNEDWQLK